MPTLRQLENRLYAAVRHPHVGDAAESEPVPWSVELLRRHKYCLLTSYRANGDSVSTPVWFGIQGDNVYVRSGSQDGKVKRIRRNPRVLLTPCGARGGLLGQPMEGRARILPSAEHDVAERALRAHYGLGRMIYRLLRRRLDATYIEVSP